VRAADLTGIVSIIRFSRSPSPSISQPHPALVRAAMAAAISLPTPQDEDGKTAGDRKAGGRRQPDQRRDATIPTRRHSGRRRTPLARQFVDVRLLRRCNATRSRCRSPRCCTGPDATTLVSAPDHVVEKRPLQVGSTTRSCGDCRGLQPGELVVTDGSTGSSRHGGRSDAADASVGKRAGDAAGGDGTGK